MCQNFAVRVWLSISNSLWLNWMLNFLLLRCCRQCIFKVIEKQSGLWKFLYIFWSMILQVIVFPLQTWSFKIFQLSSHFKSFKRCIFFLLLSVATRWGAGKKLWFLQSFSCVTHILCWNKRDRRFLAKANVKSNKCKVSFTSCCGAEVTDGTINLVFKTRK